MDRPGWAGWLCERIDYHIPFPPKIVCECRNERRYCGHCHHDMGTTIAIVCIIDETRPDQTRPNPARPYRPIHLSVLSTSISKLTILMLNDDYINVHEIWKWWNGVANMYIYCQRQSSTLKTRWVTKIKLTVIHQGLEWMQQRIYLPKTNGQGRQFQLDRFRKWSWDIVEAAKWSIEPVHKFKFKKKCSFFGKVIKKCRLHFHVYIKLIMHIMWWCMTRNGTIGFLKGYWCGWEKSAGLWNYNSIFQYLYSGFCDGSSSFNSMSHTVSLRNIPICISLKSNWPKRSMFRSILCSD